VASELLTRIFHHPSEVSDVAAQLFLSLIGPTLPVPGQMVPTKIIAIDSILNPDIREAIKATTKIARFIAPIATIICTILAVVPG